MPGIGGGFISFMPDRVNMSELHLFMNTFSGAMKLGLQGVIYTVKSKGWIFMVKFYDSLSKRNIVLLSGRWFTI